MSDNTRTTHYDSIISQDHIPSRLKDIRFKIDTDPGRCISLLTELEAIIPENLHTELTDLYDAQAQCYMALDEFGAAREVTLNGINLVVKTIPNGITHGCFLKKLGDIDFAQGYQREATEHYLQTLEIYRNYEYSEGIAVCLVCLGNCYASLGDFKNGFKYFSEGLEAARESHQLDSEISALIGKANSYIFMSRYAEALEVLHPALKLSEEVADHRRIINITINIGLAFKKMGKLEQALDYNQRALELIRAQGDKRSEGVTLLNTGAIYYDKGDKLEALNYFNKSLETHTKIGNTAGQAVCYNNIGTVYTELGRHDEAHTELLKSLEMRRNAKNIRGEAITLSALGKLMHVSGKAEDAHNYLSQALTIAESAEITETEYEVRTELVKVLKTLQRTEDALLHAEMSFEAYKRMFNSEAESKAAMLRIQFETEQAIKDSERERVKNAELAQANEKLIALSDERNEFIAMAAHDLKNPLHSIKMLLNFIQNSNPDLAKGVQENLLEIKTSVVDMLDLIQKLLDTETIESGGIYLRSEPFFVAEIVSHVLKRYDASAAIKNLKFHEKLDNTIAINADTRYLIQIVDNLISNAVKYSPHGKNINIRVLKHKENLRIEVQDEGQGLDSDEIERLFGKFQRLSPRPTGGEHSTGLGLFIAKKLTEAMDGKIWCESEFGKGSTFILEFPVAEF